MAAHAECNLGTVTLPVTLVDSRAQATVAIDGQQVTLMVDTGAFFSSLTEPAARQLNLRLARAPEGLTVWGLTGIIDMHMTTVKTMKVNQVALSDIDFLVGGNDFGRGVSGLLGRNLLALGDAEYDLANGVIRLVTPSKDCDGRNMAYWAGDTPVTTLDLVDRGGRLQAIEVDVRVNGKRVRAMLDSGADSALSLDAAHDAGIRDADMTPQGVLLGAGHGEGKLWSARVAKLELGEEEIDNSTLEVGDFEDPQMLLGIDFFLSHHLYVSRKQHKLFMTYNGGQVFSRNVAAPQAQAASSAASGAENASADALLRRGTARAARGDNAGALADLDRACALAPDVAANFVRRGEVHLAMDQQALALADFDVALRLDPRNAEALLQRVDIEADQDRRDPALADLATLQATLTPQSNLHREMASHYLSLDLPAQAIAQLDQWLAAHPHDAARAYAFDARCWARLRLGIELDKAWSDCDDAVDEASDNGGLIGTRAWVHLRRAEWRDARRDFDRALKLSPHDAWSLYGRGLLRTHQGDADGGRADLEAARKLTKNIDERVRHSGAAGDLLPAAAP